MARSVAEKLMIRPGTTVWASRAERHPPLGELPVGVVRATVPAEATAALVFADDAASLRSTLDVHARALAQPAVLWIAYPEGNGTDINRDSIWPILGEHGFRPVGQAAVDDVWSAMRFRPLAEGEAPFTGGR